MAFICHHVIRFVETVGSWNHLKQFVANSKSRNKMDVIAWKSHESIGSQTGVGTVIHIILGHLLTWKMCPRWTQVLQDLVRLKYKSELAIILVYDIFKKEIDKF